MAVSRRHELVPKLASRLRRQATLALLFLAIGACNSVSPPGGETATAASAPDHPPQAASTTAPGEVSTLSGQGAVYDTEHVTALAALVVTAHANGLPRDCEVLVDGSAKGRTFVSLSLSEGIHQVRLEGCGPTAPEEQYVDLVWDQPQTIGFQVIDGD